MVDWFQVLFLPPLEKEVVYDHKSLLEKVAGHGPLLILLLSSLVLLCVKVCVHEGVCGHVCVLSYTHQPFSLSLSLSLSVLPDVFSISPPSPGHAPYNKITPTSQSVCL